MFDWFWDFLYGITKGLLRLIDGLMLCANKLCGIDPINVDGEETDFLTYLFYSNEVTFAFRVAAVLGTIVVVFFAVFAIIRAIGSEKAQETPSHICVKTFKTLIVFFFVPAFMIAFSWILNVFMRALYEGTTGGASSIGHFLFAAFADGAELTGVSQADLIACDYTSTSDVWEVVELSDYNFIFSWIAGIAILICVAIAMISFIDRAISIVILYIAAPFSIASSVLDDGGRFKLWRDQILVKFINGYGMILGINIYALVVSLVTREGVQFFENGFINNIMKVTIILGGAFGMQRLTAVIGNLVSAGAGTNEARENMMVAASTGGALKTAALSPFKAGRGIFNFGRDAANFGLGSTIGSRLGFKTEKDYLQYHNQKKKAGENNGGDKGNDGKSNNKNDNKSNYNDSNKKNDTTNALTGNATNNNSNKNNNPGSGNNNNNKPNNTGSGMIEMAILNNKDGNGN